MGQDSARKRARRQARQNPEEGIIGLPANSLDGPMGPKLLEKKFRMVLDLSVTVKDIDPAAIRQHMEKTCRQQGREQAALRLADSIEAQAKLQQKLLQAVLAHPPTLERLLRSWAVDILRDMQDAGETYEILAPVIATLAPEEVQFLQDAENDGVFSENTDHFTRAIVVSDPTVTFEERPVGAGR